MNKIIKMLYADATEDNAFYSDESEAMYKRVSDTIASYGMTFKEEDKLLTTLVDYSIAVEQDAFEVGFKMAMELFAGGNLS